MGAVGIFLRAEVGVDELGEGELMEVEVGGGVSITVVFVGATAEPGDVGEVFGNGGGKADSGNIGEFVFGWFEVV